jgi:hypothetical protein
MNKQTKISKLQLKRLVEAHVRKYLTEQALEQNAGSAYDKIDPQDVKDNIRVITMILKGMSKFHPKQKEAAMLALSGRIANEAEDNVGLLPDRVAETLMFLDTEPQKSIRFAANNVPSEILFKWLNTYKKEFDLIANSRYYRD